MRSASSAGTIFSGRNRALLGDPLRWRRTGGARWTDRIRLREPLAQLLLQIRPIQKASLLEERAFHPPDQILDAAFLLRAIWPTHFDAKAEIERHTGKGRIPLSDHAIPAPLQRHGLRSIEHRDQGNAAEGGNVIDKRTHQRFDLLVGDQRHFCPARVLQSRGEEVHDLLRPVLITDAHLAEIMLGGFAGEPFESHQRRHHSRPQRLGEGIDRALPTRVACLPCAVE
jgi:hypothetical protein